MIETMTKVGIFTLGVVVGTAASWTYFKKKYEKIANEEIESVKNTYKNSKVVVTPIVSPIVTPEVEEENKGLQSVTYSTDGENISISYRDFYQGSNKLETSDLSEMRTIFPEEEEQFEISPDDYESDNDFVKITLNYYTEDGVLIFEESEEIAEDEKTVGIQNLDDFCRVPNQTAYFRDPKLKIDYEVIKVYGSYHELIAGDV